MTAPRSGLRDAVVLGGGPGGAAAANLLAAAGRDVIVLEGAKFPRFKVGESLLPADLPIFERLGIDLGALGFLRKSGAVFVDERRGKERRFAFEDGLPGTPDHAFQVERSRFDVEMLRCAQDRGAAVEHEAKVVATEITSGEVSATTADGRVFRGRYLVDATGQKAWLGRKARSIEPYRDFGRAAVFRRYEGLRAPARAALEDSGDIVVFLVDQGWMWVIPLGQGKVSIGLVLQSGKVEPSRLEASVASSPRLRDLLEGCVASRIESVGNFSYRNVAPQGSRYCCVGDARGFLDPIFSSGISLALFGAEKMADLLVPALEQGREAHVDLMDPLSEHLDLGYEVFERFIRRYYSSNMVDNLFFATDPSPQFLEGVVSVLAGDLWRDDNVFQRMLLASRRHVAS